MAKYMVDNTDVAGQLVEELLHVQRTKNIIIGESSWISGEMIDGRASDDGKQELASSWESRGRIFSVRHGEKEFFPAYQFDVALQPLPVIKEILMELGDVADGWRVAAWFHFPNGWLSYRDQNGAVIALSPKDALERVKDVVDAARRSRGTYVA